MSAPERLVSCDMCGGDGAVLETVHVYGPGCGFSHPDVVSNTCPVCDGAAFSIEEAMPDNPEKIVVDHWRKPIPTDQFDWSAWFDNDEPNDDGQMLMGYGATESEAIADLLMNAEV